MGTLVVPEIWKKVVLGMGVRTAGDLRRAVESNRGCRIGGRSSSMLDNSCFTVSSKPVTIDLVCRTTAELTGKKDGGTTQEVFAGAQRQGFQECPAEVGPQLRAKYLDQPYGEWLYIFMAPLVDAKIPLIFAIGRDGRALWLRSHEAYAHARWSGPSRWVLMCPRA